jgi:hypothetical protein
MQKVEIAAYVISELGKNINHSDVILSLCEKMGIKWTDAEQIVREVQASNTQEIVTWKNPVLILFNALLLIFGIGLVLSFVFVPLFDKPSQLQRLFIGIGMILVGIIGLRITLDINLKAR